MTIKPNEATPNPHWNDTAMHLELGNYVEDKPLLAMATENIFNTEYVFCRLPLVRSATREGNEQFYEELLALRNWLDAHILYARNEELLYSWNRFWEHEP